MAYVSAAEGGYGSSLSIIPGDASHAESVSVADAELLFRGQFHRAGPDLVLTGPDGRHHLIPGYFAGEKHPALVAPNGAGLSPDLVDLLAGSPTPGAYAQAQPTAPPDAIGKVEKVVGSVTVMRNGVAVALHVGDAVYKSDVIQTGANSSVGIGFPDGTALNLVPNTRMALNDYSYDASGTSNGALFSLVEGTFAFVAGKVAHTGSGMKIETPVATMGIRGTTGFVEQVATITATVGNVTYSFAVVDDPGSTGHGQYDLIDANGNIIATVSQTGTLTYVTPQGPGAQPLVQIQAMTAAQIAFEQAIIQQVVQTLNLISNPSQNSQPTPGTPGSSTPPAELNNLPHLLQENGGNPFTINIPVPGPSGPTNVSGTVTITNNTVATSQPSSATVAWQSAANGTWETGSDWGGGSAPGTSQGAEINLPVKVTIDEAETVASLIIGATATLNIIGSNGSLTVANGISNAGVLQINSSGADPTLKIDGTVYLLDGGEIAMLGATAENLIIGVPGSSATLVNVDNTIIGSGTIGQGDGNLTLVNGSAGLIEAKPLLATDSGILVIDTGNTVSNSGGLEAVAGGTLQVDDPVNNLGTILADGGTVNIADDANAGVQNSGLVEAIDGGAVSITGSVTNAGGATIEALGTGSTISLTGYVANANGATMEAVNGGTLDLNITDGGSNNYGTIAADGGTVNLNATGITVNQNSGGGNFGTMEAVDGGTLTITGGIPNSGTIEATADSSVLIEGNTVTNYAVAGDTTVNGTIEAAGTDAIVALFGATIVGGILETSDGGTIGATSGIDTFESVTVAGGSFIQTNVGATADLQGTTTLGGTVTFEGGGTFTLEGSGAELSGAAGVSELDNYATLTGGGQLGGTDSQFYLVNESIGVIDADATGDPLVINNASPGSDDSLPANAVVNLGTIEATAAGRLVIQDTTISNAIDPFDNNPADNTGVVEVAAGAHISLHNGTILYGTVSIAAGGEIDTVSGTTDAISTANGLDNLTVPTIINAGVVAVGDGSSLTLVSPDAIDNTGTIELNSTGDATNLTFDQGFAGINGGGQITLSDSAENVIAVATSGDQLTNFDNTISGAGTIGTGGMVLVNGGTIDAEYADAALTLDPTSLTNTGTLEATDGATLIVASAVSGSGSAMVSGGGILDFQSSVAATQTIAFTDATGTLALGDPTDFHAIINGLVAGDTIDLTNTAVTSAVWNGSTLSINGEATAFQISELPSSDTIAFKSDDHGGTDLVVVPQALDFTASAVVGVEGTAIPLSLSDTLTGATLTSVAVSGIPQGATLSDANHDTLTITNGSITLDASELVGLAITPSDDSNFNLSVVATATDGNGYNYTVPVTESVTVDPLAPTVTPVAVAGVEGSAITLDLGIAANSEAGDSPANSLYAVTLSDIPSGATLSDSGGHALTITNGDIVFTASEIADGYLTGLAITPANDTGFTLNVSAQEQDSQGNLSTVASSTEAVAVVQNLAVNGGFETGNLSGWTTSGADQPQYDFVTNTPSDVHSGTYALSIGPINAEWDVYQDISTVPGDTYQVEFWLSNPDGGTPSNFTASFGSTTLLSLNDTAAQNYTEYTYAVTATGTSTELLFVGEQNPAYWYLDDVSVVDVHGVAVSGTESATIESGATLELGASDSQTITFAADIGTLKLDSPSTFTGQIAGFTGTAANANDSDVIDLAGINYNSGHFSDTYNSTTGVLTVTDGTNTASLAFVGFTGAFKFASDGAGGTDIFDPPASNSPGARVSIGGPGNDNFIFHPSLGADPGASYSPDATAELERLTAAQAQHWSPMIGSETYNDAIEFVHHSDGTMPLDPSAAHWHLALQNAVHLH